MLCCRHSVHRGVCRYIRYIYNRIILENATVRAAAVSALANFGAKVRLASAANITAVVCPSTQTRDDACTYRHMAATQHPLSASSVCMRLWVSACMMWTFW